MSATCPSGHESTTEDYCDQCGARIGGAPPPPVATAQPTTVLEAVSAPEPCPECGAERASGERFCEGCGYDFSRAIARPRPDARAAPAHDRWEVVVSADRAQFERLAPEGMEFPGALAPRVLALGAEEVRIGRGSAGRGSAPDIDLGAAPQDPAVSHAHAVLRRLEDGSYAVVDVGSTNGTIVGDGRDPIAPNTAVPLADGDRIHLGAWTAITVRRYTGEV